MKKLVVIKYNNAFDIFRSLEAGVVQVKGSINSQAGDFLVFNDTSNKSYILGGIITEGRKESSTKIEWLDTTQLDYVYEHKFKSVFPIKVFSKLQFESKFPNSRSIKEGTPKGISFHHTIELDDEQLRELLS